MEREGDSLLPIHGFALGERIVKPVRVESAPGGIEGFRVSLRNMRWRRSADQFPQALGGAEEA